MSYTVRIDSEALRARLGVVREAIMPNRDDMVALGDVALNRIYIRTAIEGKDGFGNSFEPYSTKPLYVGPSSEAYTIAQSAGGRTQYLRGFGSKQNKAGKFTFHSGTRRRRIASQDPFMQSGSFGGKTTRSMLSIAFDGGYAQLKAGAAAVGAAAAGIVNLVLTGKLMGSGAVFEGGKSDAAFEIVSAEDRKVSLGFTRAERELVAQGLTERGRDFWRFGDIEEEQQLAQEFLIEERIIPRLRAAVEG